MCYNAKNHFEQGGDRLVIGGEMSFEEGAEIVGFPASPAPGYRVLDLSGVNAQDAEEMGLDISEVFSVAEFQSAIDLHTPLMLTGLTVYGCTVDILLNFSLTGDRLIGLGGLTENYDGELSSIVTFMVYNENNTTIRLRVNLNNKLQTLLSN